MESSPDNGVGWQASLDRRLGELERERGGIAGELGGIASTLESILARLAAIEDKLDERPTKPEMQALERGLESVRARARVPSLSELEITGPYGWKTKLVGFSGVTIVLVLVTAVAGILAWFVLK